MRKVASCSTTQPPTTPQATTTQPTTTQPTTTQATTTQAATTQAAASTHAATTPPHVTTHLPTKSMSAPPGRLLFCISQLLVRISNLMRLASLVNSRWR